MGSFFIILMAFFIVVANIVGFISYQKKNNIFFMAFTILLFAVLFGAMGGILALILIRDAFAIFYGMQVGYYLLINSVIVFIIAILVTVFKNYRSSKV